MASSSSSCDLLNEEPERQSLQKPAKKSTTKKSNYGSLKTEIKQTIINYQHKIKQGETLQGLSLKYGVPVELIKRANRLWTNDLAFIKDTIIIPLEKEKIKQLNLAIDDQEEEYKNLSTFINKNGDNNNNNLSIDNENIIEKSSLTDYLNKFDSFLNESKQKLKSLESNSNLKNSTSTSSFNSNGGLNESNDYYNNKRNNLKKNSTIDNSSSRLSSSSFSSNEQTKSITPSNSNLNLNTTAPELLITSPNKYSNYYNSNHNLIVSSTSTNITSGRAKLAHENLQRLEKEKDDLYEL